MKPQLRRMGEAGTPVVIVDQVTGDPGAVVDIAAALSPFPRAEGTYYPGLRRRIGAADLDAMAYVERTLQAIAPFIGGAFDAEQFDLVDASFSMVVARPETLAPAQRAPHFDSTDPDYLAVLHYLSDTPGTAFYRQRATGIEVVTAANQGAFVAQARRESASLGGYTSASNSAYEQVGLVEGRADRLVIYPGRLLHSGVIPADMSFSDNPRQGRLTANIFVRARR